MTLKAVLEGQGVCLFVCFNVVKLPCSPAQMAVSSQKEISSIWHIILIAGIHVMNSNDFHNHHHPQVCEDQYFFFFF